MARGTTLLSAVVLASSAAALGCKSNADPGAAFIAQYCDLYQPCCSAAGLPADGKACRALFASASSPKAKIVDQIFDTYLQRGVRPYVQLGFMPEALSIHPQPYQHHWTPKAKYDDTAGQACLMGLQQQSSQPGFCTGDVVPPSACAEAFGGAMGNACIQDSECPPSSQGDVRCVSGFVNNMQVRKCQTQSRGAAPRRDGHARKPNIANAARDAVTPIQVRRERNDETCVSAGADEHHLLIRRQCINQ